MSGQVKVLLVHRSTEMRNLLQMALELSLPEVSVLSVDSGSAGVALASSEDPDLVVVGLDTADMALGEAIKALRDASPQALVVVTRGPGERVSKFCATIGADAFIARPAALLSFLVGLSMNLRGAPGEEEEEAIVSPTTEGGVTIDLEGMRVLVPGQEVMLTPLEVRVLSRLMQREGTPVPMSELLEVAWGSAGERHRQQLKTLIRTLRLKLGDNTRSPRIIISHRGFGYRFAARGQDPLRVFPD